MADDQGQAAQALKEAFRRDAIEAARSGDKPRRGLLPEGRAGAWIIVIVVLGLFASLFTFVGLQLADRINVNNTIGQFCTAEEDGNYTAAYQLLSQRARALMTSSDLADTTKSAHLMTCGSDQPPWYITLTGNRATVPVLYLVTESGSSAYGVASDRDFGTIGLVRENGSWRIDAVSMSSTSLV